MKELLDLVDELTEPQTVTVTQQWDGISHTTRIQHPSRLHQLADAVTDAMSSEGSSAALASERNVINTSALMDLLIITQRIEDWARQAGADVNRNNPSSTLRRWYVKWSASTQEPAKVSWHIRQLQKWVAEIDTLLDPPRVWELPNEACPICDANTWFNPKTREEYKTPLIVSYRETGPNMIQDARGLCRACDKAFTVRELAYAIEQKAAGNV